MRESSKTFNINTKATDVSNISKADVILTLKPSSNLLKVSTMCRTHKLSLKFDANNVQAK